MKRRLLLGVLAVLALGGCEKPPAIAVVYIEEKSVTVGVGEKYQLTLHISPSDADAGSVSWISENPEIASVDRATGELTGWNEGTTRVAATARGGVPAFCEVMVEYDVLTNVPDPVLREYLLQHYDHNRSGYLSLDEANTSSLLINSLEISSLEGLEYFPNLARLTIDGCKVASFNLPELPHLTSLNLYNMQLTELDVSALTSLTTLYCSRNNLTLLDVSMLPALEFFNCGNNILHSIDISNNPRLQLFHCEGNPGADGVFAVRSWFDNDSVPTGPVDPDDPDSVDVYQFSESWEYDGQTVTVDYQKAI